MTPTTIQTKSPLAVHNSVSRFVDNHPSALKNRVSSVLQQSNSRADSDPSPDTIRLSLPDGEAWARVEPTEYQTETGNGRALFYQENDGTTVFRKENYSGTVRETFVRHHDSEARPPAWAQNLEAEAYKLIAVEGTVSDTALEFGLVQKNDPEAWEPARVRYELLEYRLISKSSEEQIQESIVDGTYRIERTQMVQDF